MLQVDPARHVTWKNYPYTKATSFKTYLLSKEIQFPPQIDQRRLRQNSSPNVGNALIVIQVTLRARVLAYQIVDLRTVIQWDNFTRHQCANVSYVAGNDMLDALRFDHVKCIRLREPKWPYDNLSFTSVVCASCKYCRLYLVLAHIK